MSYTDRVRFEAIQVGDTIRVTWHGNRVRMLAEGVVTSINHNEVTFGDRPGQYSTTIEEPDIIELLERP